MNAHWSVYKDEYADWRFQLIGDDGAIMLESEPHQDRALAEAALYRVVEMTKTDLEVRVQPYASQYKAGEFVDNDLPQKGLFE